ncbi:prepilin peptidase [Bifidobacterium gallicum]|uniref:Peptidase A24 n=1 Tax=Bifidobacterium gallicum DSM 20093 = LMG 11596 TaxID=561180 RepID=D1NSB1_9BIFI|nr:prepilin peptidase [Bifidobacterium gallicum]EFA23563.1 hypothetical protein BIFGAL_02667 [Bifidobacterium gallicum DSM 20093 = LMG 11596]KFI58636.1 peptidase A24 [Bifidobacterium gallicum DSM 20093 = LMG 11596]
MNTVVAIPGLICAAVLCAGDIRRRRVSRRVVIGGIAAQLATQCGWGWLANAWMVPAAGLSGMLIAGLMQWILASVVPGSLGFGDVTCAMLLGTVLGPFGAIPFTIWWLVMGVIGLGALGWASRRAGAVLRRKSRSRRRRHHISIPFVPVMLAAAVITIVVSQCGLHW